MSESKKHAILSPSGADRWMPCPGSVKLSKDLPDIESAYATEGTDYHEVAAVCLEEGGNAADFVGRPMVSEALVTDDGAAAVQEYVDAVRTYAAAGTLLVEERVPLTWLTGEPDAEGTLDAGVIPEKGDEITICDLKFGRGVVVEVERNRQLMIYALAFIQKHELDEFYKTVRLVICQPRAGGTKEWVVTKEELKAFEIEVRNAALDVQSEPDKLVPSEKACRWCRAKAICPALTKIATEEFPEVIVDSEEAQHPSVRAEQLGKAMDKIELIEAWIKGVRAAVEIELLAGRPVYGWKLVQGKRGNRKWILEGDAETLLKSFRMKTEEMYDLSLISPTTAAKRIEKQHPRRWAKLLPMIVQKEGVPSVAPESDPRPAMVMEKPEEGFEDVAEDFSDLL